MTIYNTSNSQNHFKDIEEKLSKKITDLLNVNKKPDCSSCMLFAYDANYTIIEDERNIVEVNFKGKRKEFYLNPDNLTLNYNDYVIVEIENGYDIGFISELSSLTKIKRKNLGLYNENLFRIISLAKEKDLLLLRQQREEEEKAKKVFNDLIIKNSLDLKLIDIEIQFDHNKITFYFTSDNRVDFRQLVKDLAAIYRTRIELRQIGARDSVKKLGALASCGRELCCCTFLDDMKRISIQDVKYQRQIINPSKLNGLCGRLKCCMSYETELYTEANHKFPELLTSIKTKRGEAIVSGIDIFNERVLLHYTSTDQKETISLTEFEKLICD